MKKLGQVLATNVVAKKCEKLYVASIFEAIQTQHWAIGAQYSKRFNKWEIRKEYTSRNQSDPKLPIF